MTATTHTPPTAEIEWSIEQQEAIDICKDPANKIAAVCGRAGTGKTSILRAVYDELLAIVIAENPHLTRDECKDRIALAAFTGKAARRITEATGIKAMTIHRMLRFSMPQDDEDFGLPAHGPNNPMPYDYVLLDEFGMTDENLWRTIVNAMKRGGKVRIFGDVNQLPPIQGPSPFHMAIKKWPSVELTHNYRSGDGIIQACEAVLSNRMPQSNDQVKILRPSDDVFGTLQQLTDATDYTLLTNQIIVATKNTQYGTVNINRMMQLRYNKNPQRHTVYTHHRDGSHTAAVFKPGDKIIWDKNDYNLNVMNGTMGRIIAIDESTGEYQVAFETGDITIPAVVEIFDEQRGEKVRYDPRTYMLLGYAVTTHKSQGSQFDNVIFVSGRSRAATRQNTYTAMTRAKSNLTILNVRGSLSSAISTLAKVD